MNEKQIILELLEQGKITKDEALRLIEAINKAENSNYTRKKSFERSFRKVGKSLDKLSDEAVEKYKKYEPVFNEKTEVVRDRASDIINDVCFKIDTMKKKRAEDIFDYEDFDK